MPASKPRRPTQRAVLTTPSVDDDATKRALTSVTDAVQALQREGAFVISNVRLPNSQPVYVSHSLGKAPRIVLFSAPRLLPGAGLTAAGVIYDFGSVSQSGTAIDRSRSLQIGNFLFGQDVFVDIMLVP